MTVGGITKNVYVTGCFILDHIFPESLPVHYKTVMKHSGGIMI